jgi:hypothetical protein
MAAVPASAWPELPLAPWADTLTTLHLWSQIVGKVRLRCSPLLPHWWQATLYVTPRGLTTGSIPHGGRSFELRLDLVAHELVLETSDGQRRTLPLQPRSVADLYRELMARLGEVGCPVDIATNPVEVAWTTPLDQDEEHASYDPEAVARFHRALVQAERVLQVFRSWFRGKCSPVHLFWGSFDLAVTRFSGRVAPPHPGGVPNAPDWMVREAYSHEVCSAGFWPGQGLGEAAFYSYAYPEPEGLPKVRPAGGRYEPMLREFVLPYAEVRASSDPDATVLRFLQSTWEAAAGLGRWNRRELERTPDELLHLAGRLGVDVALPPEPVA